MPARGIVNLVFVFTLGSLLGGCTGAPRVMPTSAIATEATDDAVRFAITLELSNTGTDEIPIDWYNYRFVVRNLGYFSGDWAAKEVIPPGATITMTVPAVIQIDEENRSRLNSSGNWAWSIDGGIRYQASGLIGRVLFDAGIRRPTENFSGSGTFQITEPPPLTQNP